MRHYVPGSGWLGVLLSLLIDYLLTKRGGAMRATVKIETSTSYDLYIYGRLFKGFTRKDTWNGFTEYTGPAGTVIVDEPVDGLSGFLANILEPFGQKTKAQEFTIVKASPSLIGHIKVEQQVEPEVTKADYYQCPTDGCQKRYAAENFRLLTHCPECRKAALSEFKPKLHTDKKEP